MSIDYLWVNKAQIKGGAWILNNTMARAQRNTNVFMPSITSIIRL